MKKGYFETVTENHFKTLEDGTRVFYAQGPLGRRGYAVPTPELEAELRKALSSYHRLIISCGVIGGLSGTILRGLDLFTFIGAIVVAMAIAYVITYLYYRRYTKGLEVVVGSHNSPLDHCTV